MLTFISTIMKNLLERFFPKASSEPEIPKPLKIEYYTSSWGNQAHIEWYYNSVGYNEPCRKCGGKTTYQLAWYDHIWQPQGSLWFCEICVPPNYNSISD